MVLKRDGKTVEFQPLRIYKAVSKAFIEVDKEMTEEDRTITVKICRSVDSDKDWTVDEIQDVVIASLRTLGRADVSDAYQKYRQMRDEARKNTIEDNISSIVSGGNDYWNTENANKNPRLNTTIRDYIAGEVSKDITMRRLLPPDIREANAQGIIHFHDADYFIQKEYNCCLVNLEDMFQNGTVISETTIDKPHSFYTACNITTQILAQVASNQYGGQSFSLAHLAPFVDISRKSIYEAVLTETEMLLGINRDNFDNSIIANAKLVTEKRVREEITRGIQTIQYQLITLNTCNGQAPFVTMFMYLNEAKNEQEKNDLAMVIDEVLKQRTQGVKGKDGSWIAPAFPKLIYVLEPDNITEDSKYWYLTELAAKCTSKRLVPDYVSEKKMLEYKGDVYTPMGCRSFLTPDRFTDVVGNIANAKNYNGKHKYYGRFNQGVVTINLPDIALSSGGDIDKFWELFEERTELCHKALMVRHKRLLGTTSDVSPILWQYGAIARLQPGEKIDKLLYHGYSTISLGYAGLYECVKYMTGHSHSDEGIGTAFGLEIMQALNDKCAQWKMESDIDFSLYGTPLEAATYKFAMCLKKRFGDDVFVRIDGHDRDYVTNSYHVVVTEEIDAFNKLRIESMFQELSPGGAISYVETPDMSHNITALLEVIKYMYEHIMYAEINTKSCHCEKCGYDGDIPLLDEDGKFVWRCPNCGNEDIDSMDISLRVCGYIGKVSHGMNKGRLNEVHERVKHIDDKPFEG